MERFKLISIVILLTFTMQSFSQNLTQKYNSYLERTEFYDSSGKMVAYAKENTYLNRTEYPQ